MYCNGIKEANVSTWNKLMDIYLSNQNKNTRILEYLTCSENSDILINFMKINTSNNFIIQKNEDYYDFISYIIQKHSDNIAIMDYILKNSNKVIPR